MEEQMDSKTNWLVRRQEAYDWLLATFPASIGAMKPLKIGVHKNILNLKVQLKPANVWLRRAMALHTSRPIYLQKIKNGSARVDLDGNDDAYITEQEEQGALERLKARRAKSKREPVKTESPLKDGKTILLQNLF